MTRLNKTVFALTVFFAGFATAQEPVTVEPVNLAEMQVEAQTYIKENLTAIRIENLEVKTDLFAMVKHPKPNFEVKYTANKHIIAE